MTWYFISYAWRHIRHSSNWNIGEEITQTHPILFLLENRVAGKGEEEHGLLFWKEIEDDLALALEDEFG
jgi:hypothetical protein